MSDCAKKCKKENGFYGTTTLGERGQVVIPAKAREDFKLEKGEQLLVFGMGKGPSDLKEMFEPMRKGPMGDPVEKFFNELLCWARALKRARTNGKLIKLCIWLGTPFFVTGFVSIT